MKAPRPAFIVTNHRHASSDITMEIYTHAQDDAKRKVLEKFEARLVQ
jgi:hypothetical protein